MRYFLILILSFSAICILSCKGNSKSVKQKDTINSNTSLVGTKDDIVESTVEDENGQILEMVFNNTKHTASLTFKGENIELAQQRSGSGIRYSNDHYELRGKGENVELIKDSEIVFRFIK